MVFKFEAHDISQKDTQTKKLVKYCKQIGPTMTLKSGSERLNEKGLKKVTDLARDDDDIRPGLTFLLLLLESMCVPH